MTKTVRVEVRDLYSPDIDVRTWEPDSPEQVRFLLELEIGEANDQRADLFQVVVATPEGLRSGATTHVISDRATLVVSNYTWPQVRREIERIVEQCRAPTWEETVLMLQRFFRWEYENYSSATGKPVAKEPSSE